MSAARPFPVRRLSADRARAELREVVLAGLRASPKTLPPRLFYDDAGARLFERITELDEYYLTRAELQILAAHAADIASLAGPRVALVEYGSGAGRKVRLLLDALESPAAYVPIDIAGEQLAHVAADLRARYAGLDVRPLLADYTTPLHLPFVPGARRTVAFFPGSTIGNFTPPDAVAFLRRVRLAIGPAGALVLGIDRVKPVAELRAAYNDAAGVTAAFNRNLLVRLNRELDATFDLDRFEHRAIYESRVARIEMHLVSLDDQQVLVDGEPIHFARGESIWTESSYKYDRPRLEALVTAAGFRVERLWTDRAERFWVTYLVPRPA
jgi:L-histidine N-alpha-methyltransferase